MDKDFRKYAVKHLGMNGLSLDGYAKINSKLITPNITSSYISPTIIEERQLNVAQMDVFSSYDGCIISWEHKLMIIQQT